MTYERGDWVVYSNGCRREIGRVWRVGEGVAFVCYGGGCTASATPLDKLHPYDPEVYDPDRCSDLIPDPRIGFHRFDDECPLYDPAFCPDCGKGGAHGTA